MFTHNFHRFVYHDAVIYTVIDCRISREVRVTRRACHALNLNTATSKQPFLHDTTRHDTTDTIVIPKMYFPSKTLSAYLCAVTFLVRGVQASLFPVQPIAMTVFHAGRSESVRWIDVDSHPKLREMGKMNIDLYVNGTVSKSLVSGCTGLLCHSSCAREDCMELTMMFSVTLLR